MLRPPNRNFFLIWHGQLISQLGHQAFLIASAYVVLRETQSAALVAMVLVAVTLPMVVLGPWAGTFADRHDRRSIILTADATRALVVAAVASSLTRELDTTTTTALVIAAATLNGVVNAFFTPALYAIVPDLVPARDVPSATALYQLSTQAAVLLGQAFGGVLFSTYDAVPMFLLNAAGFGYAALTASFVPPRPISPDAVASDRSPGVPIRGGLAYIRRQPGILPVLLSFAAVNTLFMPVLVLLPFYVRDVLGRGPEWYGYLLSASGAGALAGSATAAWVAGAIAHRGRLVRVCMAIVATSVLVIAAIPGTTIAPAAFAGIGCAASLISVTVISSLQGNVPVGLRGRVMALVIALSGASAPLGMILGGLAGDLWRARLPAMYAACGIAILLLACAAARMRSFDEALEPVCSPAADNLTQP